MSTTSTPEKSTKALKSLQARSKKREALKKEIEKNKWNASEVKDVPITSPNFNIASDQTTSVQVLPNDFFLSFLQNNDLTKSTLMFPLERVVSPLYPKDSLKELAKKHIEVVRRVPHIPKYYFFAFGQPALSDSRVKHSLHSFKSLLVNFYSSLFKSKVDQDSIRKQLGSKAQVKVFHLMILEISDFRLTQAEKNVCIAKGEVVYPFAAEDFKILAAASFATSKTDGSVIMWIGVEQPNKSGPEEGNTFGVRRQGLGTLLLIVMQHILCSAGFNTYLFAQVAAWKEFDYMPLRWYREKLFFLPARQTLPRFVQSRLVEASNLYVWHSSGLIRNAIRLDPYEETVTLDDLSNYALKILSSSASAQIPNDTESVPYQTFRSNYVNLLSHYTKTDGKDGVKLKNIMIGEAPQIDDITLYGDDPALEAVSKKYVEKALSSGYPLFSLVPQDNGSGDMEAVPSGEKSCLYTTLSIHLYGNKKFYWRL
jgi:hypothetical protein